MLRSLFIGLSESKRFATSPSNRRWGCASPTASSPARSSTRSFRPPEVVNEWGASVSIDNLGENVTNADEAKHSAELYHQHARRRFRRAS